MINKSKYYYDYTRNQGYNQTNEKVRLPETAVETAVETAETAETAAKVLFAHPHLSSVP